MVRTLKDSIKSTFSCTLVNYLFKNLKAAEKAKTSEPTPKTIEQYKQFSELTVFISNLSFDIDEEKLRNVFEKVAHNLNV